MTRPRGPNADQQATETNDAWMVDLRRVGSLTGNAILQDTSLERVISNTIAPCMDWSRAVSSGKADEDMLFSIVVVNHHREMTIWYCHMEAR